MKRKINNSPKNQAFHLHAKKTLGQNFLNDKDIIENIANSIFSLFKSNQKKYVHEIGPGSGALTQALLQKQISVLGLEKDQRAVQGLKETLELNYPNVFEVIQTDVLKWTPKMDTNLNENSECICIGNLPYYISSEILFWFSTHAKHYSHGIFMLQEEVADRLIAKPASKAYGRLTIRMQLFFEVKKLFKVPAHCFIPKPKVNSAIVQLTPKPFSFQSEKEDHAFGILTATLFSARRKMLRRALLQILTNLENKYPGKTAEFWHLANSFQVTEETRPDAISPEAVLAFHKFFLKYN
ncbi:16S rRNA (adenine(1518)-N(6)/adenine(1519)-N(6))-dimethyltransferase RsmA [Spirobacillus cienkowskii]|uniref:16S rRNA (adenine(1518)-N(6)/adenine(1519)-N(6))- dimethyltransferase RsmA n=1 Tax=Spirobacillus cienkowskii TaxID=495820 RepID=UPI0030CFB0AA